MRLPVSTKAFNDQCEVCGEYAELRDARSTALLQSQTDRTLSAVGCQLVRCISGDHAYLVIDWSTQIADPFPEGWEPEEES